MPPLSTRPSNPLALAVLVLLAERPMHPYEMASTLKQRGKEQSIRLNYGSLYTVIEQLMKKKWITERETLKEGNRPEKTVYEMTPAGDEASISWMRELISAPAKEYPQFEAALSLIPVLPPEEVVSLLEIRIGLLDQTLEKIKKEHEMCQQIKLPRLFMIESEYFKMMTEADRAFSEKLMNDIKKNVGSLKTFWTDLRKTALKAKKTKVPKKIKETRYD